MLSNRRDGFVFAHFVGCTADSADHWQLVRRLLLELQRCFDLETSGFGSSGLPSDREALVALLPVWLAIAAKEAPLTILLDGLDQLRDPASAALTWLPTGVPSNCSLILSSNSGTPLDGSLVRRGWDAAFCPIPPLDQDERETLAKSYLKLVNKTLEPHQLLMLTRARQASNPLFMRMSCDEMIASAVFETIDEIIAHCTAQPDCLALCEIMLQRFEHQFGRVTVERAFCYILSSRYGMETQELVGLLKCTQVCRTARSAPSRPYHRCF